MTTVGTGRDGAPDPAGAIVEVVRTLVREVRPRARLEVTLDSDLELDLGLDSLAIAELLARVEDALETRVPASLLGQARTPRDLLVAAGQVRLTTPDPARTDHTSRPADTVARPDGLATLVDSLDWHLTAHPDRVHAIVMADGHTETALTYDGLHRRARRVAAGLRHRGIAPGDAVALMLPTCADYFPAFVGIWLAGAVAVPVYPPDRPDRLAEHLRRQAKILDSARATVLITVEEALVVSRVVRAEVGSMRDICTVEELVREGRPRVGGTAPARPAPDQLALLQYTSGSTGDPKGVMLSHADLVANVDAMASAIHATPDDVFVSWLPLYHDMGLIGSWMGSLHVGMTLVVMPPQDFIVRPASWLQAISDFGGTLAAAPNFAYELCLKRVTDQQLDTLDLRTLRFAFNGAEAVSASTLRRFAERFGPAGLRPEAPAPCYGLAEAAVGLAFPPPGRGPVIDRVQRRALQETRIAEPAGPGDDAVELVACGQVLPGYELRVVDDHGRELPPRHEGHLQFRGPSATTGYVRNPEATAALFDGEWLRTGDLAYLAQGDVVLTGRAKDLIIRAGHNLHPQELEGRIGAVDGVRAGCVVVVGVPDEATGTERLVVIAETRATDEAELARIRATAVDASLDVLATPPEDLVLVAPGRVPKTSSGKLRRAEARDRYLAGTLMRRPRPTWQQVGLLALRGSGSEVRRRFSHVVAWLRGVWARLVGLLAGVVCAVAVAVVPRRRWRWAVTRQLIGAVVWLTGSRVEVEGGPVPDGGVVVVANHASWLDGLALASVLPGTLRFLVGEFLADMPLQGFVLRRLGAVFVERHDRTRGVADVASLPALLAPGETVVAFPEGRLDDLPGLRPFRLGAFQYAAQAQVPVVPVAISGTRRMLPPSSHRLRAGTAHVVIGPPVRPAGTEWADLLALRDAARDHIAANCGEPDRS